MFSRKVSSSYEQRSPVSPYLSPKYIQFCFQNLEYVIKDGNACIAELYFISQTKNV